MNRTIYIDNLEANQIQLFKDNGMEVMTPNEVLAESLKTSDSLIVLCELNKDDKGKPIKRSKFYGLKLVQELRRNKYMGKVLFVSFLSEQYFKTKVLNSKIMFFQGHGFHRLPAKPKSWKNKLKKISELDSLSLHDCIHHFCGLKGIIDEALHKLKPAILGATKIVDIFNRFDKELRAVYTGLNSSFKYDALKSLSFDSISDFYLALEKSLYSLVESNEESLITDNDIIPKYKWSVLWLDDVLKDQKMLKQELEFRGVTVQTASTVKNAILKFNIDQNTNRSISYIISDYRIEPTKGTYEKQGYQFLKEIAEKNSAIGLMAYSGLRRRFLFNSFEHYGLQVYIHSKLDFLPTEIKDVKYLADIICAYGDKHYKLINNAPQGTEWKKMANSYLNYKSSLSFVKHQLEIDTDVKATLSDFILKFQSVKSEEDLWKIRLDQKYDIPNNSWDKVTTEKTKEKRIRATMLNRRAIIAVYAFLEKTNNWDFLNRKNLVHFIKYIYRCTQNPKKELPTTSTLSDILVHIKKDKAFDQVSTFLALSLDEDVWPIGLLPEEYLWIKNHPLLGAEYEPYIDNFWKDLRYSCTQIQKVLKANEFSSLLEAEDSNQFIIAKVKKANSSGKSRNVTKKIFVDRELYPHLKTLGEVKHVIEYLKSKMIGFDHLSSASSLFVGVLEELSNRKWSPLFSSLKTFINDLDSPVVYKSFLYWYREVFTPWWFYRPPVKTWGSVEAPKEMKFREELFLAACSSEDLTKLVAKRRKDYDGIYPHEVVEKLSKICRLIFDIHQNSPEENTWFEKRRSILSAINDFKAKRTGKVKTGGELFGHEGSVKMSVDLGYGYVNKYNDKEINSKDTNKLDQISFYFIGEPENEEEVIITSRKSKLANEIQKFVTIDDRFEYLLLYYFPYNGKIIEDQKTKITIIKTEIKLTIIGIPGDFNFDFAK